MNILFYYPSNLRTNVLESQMIHLQQQGHRVYLLTIQPPALLHEYLETKGIPTASQNIASKNRLLFYRSSVRDLVRFTREKSIDIIYSHLQQANFIAVLAQPRIRSTRVIVCRHHHDRVQKGTSRTARFFDRIINKRARTIVVPSRMVYEQVTKVEKVAPEKVALIPYTYDFNLFAKPDPAVSKQIRESFPHKTVAITLTRLVEGKGLLESIEVMRMADKKGIDLGLIIAGDGPLKPLLEEKIAAYGLGKKIWLTGHVHNTMDHIAAADLMLLLTDNEASNNAVKESAFCGKTSITTHNVGDFDDYIVHEENGLLVNCANKINDTLVLLESIDKGRYDLPAMGARLREAVLDRFSIEKIIITYNKFHQ